MDAEISGKNFNEEQDIYRFSAVFLTKTKNLNLIMRRASQVAQW